MKPVVLILALLATAAMGADQGKFVVSRAVSTADELTAVPLEIESSQDLVALDIPLGFSEGAVLEKVEFTDKVSRFDYKVANIDNENRRVIIGLVTMGNKEQPDFPAGSAVIAQLYFKFDPGVDRLEIKPIELSRPDHALTYYYNDYSPGYPEVRTILPEFETIELTPSVVTGGIPDVYALSQNSPNPFNPVTRISYALPEGGNVKMVIFNILGQNIRTLVDGFMPAGNHEVVWDGTDYEGLSIASGIYFYRVQANSFSDTKKMLLLK